MIFTSNLFFIFLGLVFISVLAIKGSDFDFALLCMGCYEIFLKLGF